MTGLTHATSGTVKIADENIENVKNLWRLVGLCPQHDTIWPDLTIEDHLLFYCRLRGIPRERINGTVRRIAEDVGLDGDPFRQFASQMSGGMKRRLSIAIAMTASPKILILDEPTTGLDPDTRHKIWKVINKIAESKDRSIIITTHSMEEADALCSRIGIVCEGRLQVIGNQVHLKNKIGSGIKLTLVITMESAIDSLTEFEKNFEIIENKALEKINVQILKLICSQAIFFSKSKTHLPSLLSKLNGQSKMAIWNSTMTFVLPTEGLDIASIFERIDERKNEMMIVDWSLSQTTMEDVFIKVVEGAMRDK